MVTPFDHTFEIHSCAYNPTVEDALPTLPAAGNAITWASGWTAIPFRLTDESFSFVLADSERVEIKAPRQPLKGDVIENAQAVDRIEFASFDLGKRAYDIASDWSESGDLWTPLPSASWTAKSFAIEYKGVGIAWFPKVYIHFPGLTGGRITLGTLPCVVDVMATTTYPEGYRWAQIAYTS